MTFTPPAYVVPRGDHLELRISFADPKYVLPATLLASMAGKTMRIVHGGVDASRITLSFITGPTGGTGRSYDRGPAPVPPR